MTSLSSLRICVGRMPYRVLTCILPPNWLLHPPANRLYPPSAAATEFISVGLHTTFCTAHAAQLDDLEQTWSLTCSNRGGGDAHREGCRNGLQACWGDFGQQQASRHHSSEVQCLVCVHIPDLDYISAHPTSSLANNALVLTVILSIQIL